MEKVPTVAVPYNMIPTLPGKINLLEFDRYLGYRDNDCENSGGAFRPDEPVDIYDRGEGDYAILTEGSEYLIYTVKFNSDSKGKFRVTIPIHHASSYYYGYGVISLFLMDGIDMSDKRYLGDFYYSPEDSVCSFDISIDSQIYSSGREVRLRLEFLGNEIFIREMSIEETNNSVEDFSSNSLEIYPNPTKDEFTINIANAEASLRVFNAQGSLVVEYSEIPVGEFRFGKDLSNGIYFVEIQFDGCSETHKLVKL